jgi:[pyruvate, water dikinase]-phosphate phosphotransferase / [pyruvate, water dikinase] kinase
MDNNRTFHIHMVSDSTGETASSVVRSVMSQFENVKTEEHTWPLIRTKGQLQRVINGIKEQPGIVLFTIIDHELQEMLVNACREIRLPYVPILSRITRELAGYFGVEAKASPGGQYKLDEEYFARVEAISFTLAHDDGQNTEELDEADIVLVGVSRTSKTPTCVYLSYKGIKAANIPYVSGCPLPDKLFQLNGPFIVGLVITPERLLQIRKSRLVSLSENRETTYVNMDAIKQEVLEARQIFNKFQWPIIDVTRRSVEETCAKIMQLHQSHKDKKERDHDT